MSTASANRAATDAANFPKSAWQHVTLEAPTTLELYGRHNRGYLDVTLANNSDQALLPGSDNEIAFSYRLLDQRGASRPLECIRTPLTQAVLPGARHTQKVTVMIPAEDIEGVGAVRVGLLHEGRYWVESLYPDHPCTVNIVSRGELDSLNARLAAGGQVWTRRQSNGLRWPYDSMMVSEQEKLLYIPVAKCACTSLKSMMIRLAGIEKPELALELDIHLITDTFNTGVQLKDKPIDLARDILASDQYFKFGVIRNPFERLVSAYLEKFVYQRTTERNLLHTEEIIREVGDSAGFDPRTGINFDQFVEYIFRQDPYDLDPHWRPQYLYFLGVKHISRIFRLENIAQLEQQLRQRVGIEIQLGHENATSKSEIVLPAASELSAAELEKQGAIHPDSFLSSRHVEAIREYYREDFELYRTAV